MGVDESGLGGWWPRPDQAAAGALDHLPSDQWPALAAMWLAAGFDSPLLRQLAQFRDHDQDTRHGLARWAAFRGRPTADPSGTAGVADRVSVAFQVVDLMPEVLRSISADPGPADEALVARCQSALDVVQHDLNATGYGRYRMRALLGRGWPAAVYPTMPDGSYWGGGEGLAPEMEGAWLLVRAACSVSATLKEIPEVEWPVCAVHGGHPGHIWRGEEPAALIDGTAWWTCTNTSHRLAPVGQLTAQIANTP